MPNVIYTNKHILQGEKGDRGETPETDTTAPINGIMLFDGDEIPEGYEEVEL